MNFTQKTERSERFKNALKISFPFIFVICILIFIFQKSELKILDVLLLCVLIICYVYYTFYMIKQSSESGVLDDTTKVFKREKFEEILKNLIKKSTKNDSIVLLRFKNLAELSEIYGIKKVDKILENKLNELSLFLEENGMKKSIIGHYNASYFLMYSYTQSTKISHFLTIFSKKLQTQDISLNLDFSVVNADVDNDIFRIINLLFDDIKDKSCVDKNLLDNIQKEILDSIDDKNFSYKIQKMIDIKNNDFMYSLITSIKTRNFGDISKSKYSEVNVKNGYSIVFDKSNFVKFCEIYRSRLKNDRVLFEVSLNSIKDTMFLNFVTDYVFKNDIEPRNIIFEFDECDENEDLNLLNEIINRLKIVGFKVALGHFGGVSGAFFNYFMNLNIDYIIYDISMSKGLGSEKVVQVVTNLNKACNELGIKTIMKFIQNEYEFNTIKHCGVDYIQGFYIEKPKEIKG
ncbi:EAL domain-containing protein [Campylobacter mucosalis]|uniref:EAL domain-containing protein n=1 Tax=Campylobacter mucosalis TaxID=202 RepID=UPI0004D9DB63|nr:EAL domain-containing protein [Campylobacter mucosalis]KEA45371.1 hypothetical protein CR66_08355 [Campylobacter mucosalis]QKF62183.1 putative diguanylate phosphodiesterase [Campylobacter mucosalis]